MIANSSILQGFESPLSCISWQSSKAPRIARSSTAIEVQSASLGEEELQYCRLALGESLFGKFSIKQWEERVKMIPGALVMDCRGVFDSLSKSESSCLGMKERRTGIEALAIKRSLLSTGTSLRWCHSGAQLADCLTKGSDEAQRSMDLLKRRGFTWKIVYDPEFVAAKKRRHLDALADPDDFMNLVTEPEAEPETGMIESDFKNPNLLSEMRAL